MSGGIKFTSYTKVHFADSLKIYLEETEKSVEEALTQVAKIAAKNLISSVQPYGTSQVKGQKLEKSIAKQAHRAIMHANVIGQEGDVSSVHNQNRNQKGQVAKGLRTKGKFQRDPISVPQRALHVNKKMKNAGIAKAGWFAALEEIKGDKRGIAKYITRHKGQGSAKTTGKKMKCKIILENNVPYIESVQSAADLAKAISKAYDNFTKFMIIRRHK
jgi:hypothetical protein